MLFLSTSFQRNTNQFRDKQILKKRHHLISNVCCTTTTRDERNQKLQLQENNALWAGISRCKIITSKLIISIVNRVTFLTPPFSNAFYWRRVEHLGTKSFSDLLLREVGSEQVCRIGQRSSLTNTLTKEIVHDGIRGKTLNLPSSTKRGSFSRIRRAGADPRQGRTHTLYLPNNLEIKPRLVAQRSSMHFNR